MARFGGVEAQFMHPGARTRTCGAHAGVTKWRNKVTTGRVRILAIIKASAENLSLYLQACSIVSRRFGTEQHNVTMICLKPHFNRLQVKARRARACVRAYGSRRARHILAHRRLSGAPQRPCVAGAREISRGGVLLPGYALTCSTTPAYKHEPATATGRAAS